MVEPEDGRIVSMKKPQLIVTNARNVKPLTARLLKDNPLGFIKVISFEQYKKQYMVKTNESTIKRYWKYYRLLLDHQQRFPLLKDQFQYVSFANNLFVLFDQFHAHGLTMDQLHASSPLQKEVVAILQLLQDNTPPLHYDFNHLPHGYTTLKYTDQDYDQHLLDQLIQQEILKPLVLPEDDMVSTIDYQIGVGLNNTIETVIADLIKNKIDPNDVNIIFADQNQLNNALHLFNSYHIPIDTTNQSNQDQCIALILAMLDYYQHHDLKSLSTILNLGYPIEGVDWTIDRVDDTIHTIDQRHLNETIRYIDDLTIKHHNDQLVMLQKAREQLDQYSVEPSTPLDILTHVFELVKTSNFANATVLQTVADLVITLGEAINTKEGFNYFSTMLKNSNGSTISASFDTVVLTTITQPVVKRKYAYILGLSSTNYPGFSPLNGLVDESYVTDTSYPSLAKRQDDLNHRLQWLDHSGQTIIYRFSQLDNTGTVLDIPLAFSAKELKPIRSITRKENTLVSTKVSNVNTLLQDSNGRINASISSLECFNQCKMQYALRYLLHLRKPNACFDAATIGSLYHYILQNCIHDPTTIDMVLTTISNELSTLFSDPKQLRQMMVTLKENMVEAMHLSTQKDTYLPVSQCEYTLHDVISNFNFKAIIDRLDESGRAYGIVDYKTTNKHLSWSKIEKGEQLQLLTYAYLYEKHTDAELTYLDYVPITPQPQNHQPFHITKKLCQRNDFMDEINKTHAIKRYDGTKISGKKRPWQQVKVLVEPLYDVIYTNLISGDFSPNPSDASKPCGFCPFKSICRYTRGETIHPPLIEFIETDERSNDDALE